MLDVYGTGWFQGAVTFNAGVKDILEINNPNNVTGTPLKLNSTAGGASRNWAVESNDVAWADFTIREGTSAGSDPASGTVRFSIATGGAVQFNSYGSGTLSTDASGYITASSDARLKDIDGEFTRGSADLLAIHPKLFHWKKETGLDTTEQYAGPIAQDVLPYIPGSGRPRQKR